MSTAAVPSHDTTDRMRYLPIGLGASVVHALIMIPGYRDKGSFQTNEWITMFAISLVLAAAVFVFAVPAGGARTAVVLGVLAALSAALYWSMLSLPLAAAAIVVGRRARAEQPGATLATVGLVLGALAVVATLAFAIGDM